ncbi:cell cycle exit and neuronal differentiation protein 1-like [Lepisosteus oculatus]|uniref:cell cycle exit and neuronal differentiation protein 1-like n=1 Tax=Lepisosteus oculatus TaxID=7918 RepID=UPI0035F51A8F
MRDSYIPAPPAPVAVAVSSISPLLLLLEETLAASLLTGPLLFSTPVSSGSTALSVSLDSCVEGTQRPQEKGHPARAIAMETRAKPAGGAKAEPVKDRKELTPMTRKPADAPEAPAASDPPAPPPETPAHAAEEAPNSAATLESLKPFLLGGAVIAVAAVVVGAVLLARRK